MTYHDLVVAWMIFTTIIAAINITIFILAIIFWSIK